MQGAVGAALQIFSDASVRVSKDSTGLVLVQPLPAQKLFFSVDPCLSGGWVQPSPPVMLTLCFLLITSIPLGAASLPSTQAGKTSLLGGANPSPSPGPGVPTCQTCPEQQSCACCLLIYSCLWPPRRLLPQLRRMLLKVCLLLSENPEHFGPQLATIWHLGRATRSSPGCIRAGCQT